MQARPRLHGFGLTVVPVAPYRIELAAVAPTTRLRLIGVDQTETLDVRDVLAGACTTELAEVRGGDPRERWTIETAVARCAWPEGFALCSDPDGLSSFLLHGPGDALIWLAGPLDQAKTLPVEKLADDEQTIRAVAQTGDDHRIDLDYEVDGERWWQRRYVRAWAEDRTLLISAQARAEAEPLTGAAVDLVEATLEPTD